MAQQQAARRKVQFGKTTHVSIPDKLYFRIGDVSRLCALPAYVLRFWETEFPQLKPNKGGTGQRLYRKRDVEMVLEIKRLLYGEGFTIAGARRILTENRRAGTAAHGMEASPVKAAKSAGPIAKSKAAAASIPSRAAKPVGSAGKEQRISALRNEMREILSMLGAEKTDGASVSPAAQKRAAKKTSGANEPTLF